MSSPVLLIGIGNEYRRDDSMGLYVVRTLKREKLPGAVIVESSGDGVALIEQFSSARMAILIDAVSSGGNPGTIYRFEAHKERIPARLYFHSTHTFGVGEAIELARILRQIPPILLVYAIEGENFSAGVGLSSKVEGAAYKVIEQVRHKVEEAHSQFKINSA